MNSIGLYSSSHVSDFPLTLAIFTLPYKHYYPLAIVYPRASEGDMNRSEAMK